MTNLGDAYEQALARERGDAPAAEQVTKSEAKDTVTGTVTTEGHSEPTKPASALEAAMADQEPAKTEPTTDDPLKDLPETLPNENRKDHWAKARAAIKTQSERAALAEKKAHELETKVSSKQEVPPEILAEKERLAAENAELRDAITAANVELLPEFRQKYVDGAKALVAKAAEKAKAFGGDAEALADALTMPEGKRRNAAIREAIADIDDTIAQNRISAIISDLDKLNEEAKSEKDNSQVAYQRLTEKQQAQRLAQQQEAETRKAATFDAVTKKLQTEVRTLRFVDPTLQGGEEWNSGVKESLTKAQQLFSETATPEDTVAAAIKGTDYDRVLGLLQTSWGEAAQLRKQLAELEGAQPDVRGGRAPAKKGAEANLDRDPGDIFKETMAQMTGREDD